MTDNISIPTFYREEAVPEKWTLTDLLYWSALQILPYPRDYDEDEGRESAEALLENPTGFGQQLIAAWLEPSETQLLGLKDAPEWLNFQREERGEKRLSSPEYHEQMSSFELYEEASEHERVKWKSKREEERNLIPLAIAHEEYTKKWKESFDDALDLFRSDLIVKLRRGEIIMEGIALQIPKKR